MTRLSSQHEREQLESIIDTLGLANTLDALLTICAEKEAHVLTNWQDEITAQAWSDAYKAIEICATNKAVEAVS